MNYKQAWKPCTASGNMKNLIATDVFRLCETSYNFILKNICMERSIRLKITQRQRKWMEMRLFYNVKKEWINETAL